MAMRATPLVPSTIARVLICVDGFENFEVSGRLYNLFFQGAREFSSIYECVCIMESFFDDVSFPQAYCGDRKFTQKSQRPYEKKKEEVHQYMPDEIFNTEQGKKATFVVSVQFRQNATWQGTITWTEEKKTERFRSALEMVKLMGEALGDEGETEIGWQ